MFKELMLPDLRMMLQDRDEAGLREFCNVLYPAVAAEVLEDMDVDEVWRVLEPAALDRQVEIFEFMDLPQQMRLVDAVDKQRLSRLIEEMAPDDRVDLLSRMDTDRVEALLPLIAQAERSDIRKLLSFPENSAGAMMTTEYASLPEDITVEEALRRLRQQAPNRETIYYVFILGGDRRLDGLISLRELILARPTAKLADIMRRDVISVRVDDEREFVAHELAKYDFIAIPVVDAQNRLVGIVTHDDVLDVMQEEATEDAHRQAAVAPLEDSFLQTPLLVLAWKRGVWLLFLSGVALMTAEVLHHYASESLAHPWMVLFLPLVLASGGNAGSQSATLVIRALALGEMSRAENLRMARREFAVGGMLGLAIAAVGFCASLGWFGLNVYQGAVVLTTVLLVVVMGTVAGAMLPVLFKSFGMDPALMSNPLIAALVDVLGVVIYYSVAILVLDGLAA